MDKKSLKKFENLLLNLREEILTQSPVAVKVETEGLVDDALDEDSQPLSEMNQVIASKRNLNRSTELKKIDQALGQIKNYPDDYGLCQSCGEPIAPKRLELMPFVELCISCQGKKDAARKQISGRKNLGDYQ